MSSLSSGLECRTPVSPLFWIRSVLTLVSKLSAALDRAGKNMEVTQYTEKLVPSTRFVAVDDVAPKVSDECFVAPSASLVGDVTVGKNSRYVGKSRISRRHDGVVPLL